MGTFAQRLATDPYLRLTVSDLVLEEQGASHLFSDTNNTHISRLTPYEVAGYASENGILGCASPMKITEVHYNVESGQQLDDPVVVSFATFLQKRQPKGFTTIITPQQTIDIHESEHAGRRSLDTLFLDAYQSFVDIHLVATDAVFQLPNGRTTHYSNARGDAYNGTWFAGTLQQVLEKTRDGKLYRWSGEEEHATLQSVLYGSWWALSQEECSFRTLQGNLDTVFELPYGKPTGDFGTPPEIQVMRLFQGRPP